MLVNDAGIGVYALGKQGALHHHRFFINGQETASCSICVHRVKHLLQECSLDSFCFGMKSIEKKTTLTLDIHSLAAFLEAHRYSRHPLYEGGELFEPPDASHQIVTVHL